MTPIAIERLLPQRAPILMVDRLTEAADGLARTSFVLRPDNLFLDAEGRLEESGLIEHIAQSASAYAGYKALGRGATKPPVGYIGEVKQFRCHFRPTVGEVLYTTIRTETEMEGIVLLTGETRTLQGTAAETQLKIFMKDGETDEDHET